MSVKIDFDPNAIYSQIQKSTDVSLQEIASQVIADTEHYVPRSKPGTPGRGTLRNSVSVEKKERNSIEILYSRPVSGLGDISESLYEGYNPRTGLPVKKWSEPGTGDHWFERSVNTNYESWIEFFKQRTREIWAARK